MGSVVREGTGLTAATEATFEAGTAVGGDRTTTLPLVTQRRPTWAEHTSQSPNYLPTSLPTYLPTHLGRRW